jgi:hypothetical protein
MRSSVLGLPNWRDEPGRDEYSVARVNKIATNRSSCGNTDPLTRTRWLPS